MNNPIYEDMLELPVYKNGKKTKRFKNRRVFQLLNPVFDKWREEKRTNGKYNNSFEGNYYSKRIDV